MAVSAEGEGFFGSGIDVNNRPRKATPEVAFGGCFYLALLVQVVLCCMCFGLKNSEVVQLESKEDGSIDLKCPGDYVLAASCGQYNGQNRMAGNPAQCITKAVCEQLQTCVSNGRRLEWDDFMPGEVEGAGFLQRLAAEEGSTSPAHRRLRERAARLLLNKQDVPSGVWEFLERHFYQPTVLFASAGVLAVAWLVFLQRCARVSIWGAIIFDVVALIAIFIWYKVDFDMWNWGALIAAVVIAVGAVLLRKQIDHTAVIMKTALSGLAENKRIFLVCIAVQLVWVLYFALVIAALIEMHFVVEAKPVVDTEGLSYGAGFCSVETQQWVTHWAFALFMGLTYYWVTYFFRNINLMLITANLSGWYFEEEGSASYWVKVLPWALGTQSGANAIGAAIMGLAEYLLQRIGSTWKLVLSMLQPWHWVPLCLAIVLKTFLQTYAKFGVIAATYSGKPFFEAGPKAFNLIKDKLGEAVLVDFLGTRVMAWATYMISLGVGFASWAWADSVQGTSTFQSIPIEAVIGIVLTYAYVLSFPFAGLIVVVLCESFLAGLNFDTAVRAVLNSVMASLFMGCITMFILNAISRIVVNSMDVIFFCFAIEAENSPEKKQARFDDLYESIKATVIQGTVVQNGKSDGTVVGTAVEGQQPQSNPSGPAEQPSVVGQPVANSAEAAV